MSRVARCAGAAFSALLPAWTWGKTNTFRIRGEQEVDGEVGYLDIQWLGMHFGVTVGRAPNAARQARRDAAQIGAVRARSAAA